MNESLSSPLVELQSFYSSHFKKGQKLDKTWVAEQEIDCSLDDKYPIYESEYHFQKEEK
jgi:hypothetical protein